MFEYSTNVKIDFVGLKDTIEVLKADYDKVGTRDNHTGRSLFSRWNNIRTFYERYSEGSDILNVTGTAKGNSARIYFKPSVTSYAKPFRKHIVPTNPDNEFVFFDLRAAEFFMNCVFCQETEAVDAYHRGEDIYMHYSYLFPEGTPRSVVKKILIANMYNQTAFSVGKDLGISETQAQRLLDSIASALPKMTMMKRRIYSYCLKNKGYFAPNGFDQSTLIKVSDINPEKGFSYDYALSCYVQSALGFFMQSVTKKLLPKTTGTLLSVFDSMLIEINSNSEVRIKEWLKRELSPFIADNFTFGKTFYQAAYGND